MPVRSMTYRCGFVAACAAVALTAACTDNGRQATTTTSPATTSPATTGPATTGPATTGPATTSPATTSPATTGPATTGPATTGPATTSPVTTSPVTTEPSVSSTVACPSPGGTTPAASLDPVALSGLIGRDIRTGAHPCFERVVIELQGTGKFPGWSVGYEDDPILLGESNETAYIRGDATIVARLGSWMQTMEYEGYQGPWDIFPTNVVHIRELRLVANDEGVMRWAIGLDHQRPFTVTVLANPPRLVIDIAN